MWPQGRLGTGWAGEGPQAEGHWQPSLWQQRADRTCRPPGLPTLLSPEGRRAGQGLLLHTQDTAAIPQAHLCWRRELTGWGRGPTGQVEASGPAGTGQGLQLQGPRSAVSRAMRGGARGDRRLNASVHCPQRVSGAPSPPSQGPPSSTLGKEPSAQGAGTGHQAWRTGQGTRKYQVPFFLLFKPIVCKSVCPAVHRAVGVASVGPELRPLEEGAPGAECPRARPPRLGVDQAWGRGQSSRLQVAHPCRKVSSETAAPARGPRPAAGLWRAVCSG